MRYFSADWIYPIDAAPVRNGILVTDDEGKIIDLIDPSTAGQLPEAIERYEGLICPGFVNTHCHLELSHMRGKIAERCGLYFFAKDIITKRNQSSPEEIAQAIADADDEMYRNGIVAVGDICNMTDTFEQKRKSKIRYHNFIELLGLNPAVADAVFEKGQLLLQQAAGIPSSLVPHAPYSVSPELMRKIAAVAGDMPVSIHNQESIPETLFFTEGTGNIRKLYEFLGVDLSFYTPPGKRSLDATLPHLLQAKKILLVHNIYTEEEDYELALSRHSQLWWCSCPLANMYIENELPDYAMFMGNSNRITIGTDSLASNHCLSVLEELKQISRAMPDLTMDVLLRWATLNGAIFFGYDDLGSFARGKKPGINLVQHFEKSENNRAINSTATVKRLL